MATLRRLLLAALCLLSVIGCKDMFPPLARDLSGAEESLLSQTGDHVVGRVLGLDGKPAAGVSVNGYLISNNSGGIISNNGSTYRTQSTPLQTRTDSLGRFTLPVTSDSPLNIEAVLSDSVKAIKLNVTELGGLQLQLAYTGSLSGRVTSPGVSWLEGIDVFIPGTSYVAKTDQSGRYTLSNVAAGSFSLVANKAGLGRAHAPSVRVISNATTTVPELALAVTAPILASIQPSNGGPGSRVTLTGENFAASSGEAVTINFGGALATSYDRVSDETITAVVPNGASSGEVVVSVGSVLSNAVNFPVLTDLAIEPAVSDLQIGSQAELMVVGFAGEQRITHPAVELSVAGSSVTATLSSDGNLHVQTVSPGGATLTLKSGNLSKQHSLTVSETDRSTAKVSLVTGSGQAGLLNGNYGAAAFNGPQGLAVDKSGYIYVADTQNHVIRKFTPVGSGVGVFAGKGLPGFVNGSSAVATFNSPEGLVFDGNGNLLVADSGNKSIRRVTSGGDVLTYKTLSSTPHAIAYLAPHTFVSTDSGVQLLSSLPYGQTLILPELPGAPHGLSAEASGSLLVTVPSLNAIYRLSPGEKGSWTRQLLMSNAQAINPPGFGRITDVREDPVTGKIYVVDQGKHSIRVLGPDGRVTTVAGDRFSSGGYAEGTGTEARFNSPTMLLPFAAGYGFIVSDTGNHRIRRISLPERDGLLKPS